MNARAEKATRRVAPGDELGRWRIERAIAAGGMGTIWEATHLDLGRPAAIKVIRSERNDDEYRGRFLAEAKLLSRIDDHPNIVRLYDFGVTEDGLAWMAMERLAGMTLEQIVVARGCAPLPETMHIVAEIADGMHAVHLLGVIHRDLKPSNIFVTQKGHVKVLDFGALKPLARGHDLRNVKPSTAKGLIVGTLTFMAPEQLLNDPPPDARCDIFPLGMLGYLLLSGTHPFEGEDAEASPAAMAYRALIMEPAPIIGVPDDAWMLLRSMMAKHRDDRPQSMARVAERARHLRDIACMREGRALLSLAGLVNGEVARECKPAIAAPPAVVDARGAVPLDPTTPAGATPMVGAKLADATAATAPVPALVREGAGKDPGARRTEARPVQHSSGDVHGAAGDASTPLRLLDRTIPMGHHGLSAEEIAAALGADDDEASPGAGVPQDPGAGVPQDTGAGVPQASGAARADEAQRSGTEWIGSTPEAAAVSVDRSEPANRRQPTASPSPHTAKAARAKSWLIRRRAEIAIGTLGGVVAAVVAVVVLDREAPSTSAPSAETAPQARGPAHEPAAEPAVESGDASVSSAEPGAAAETNAPDDALAPAQEATTTSAPTTAAPSPAPSSSASPSGKAPAPTSRTPAPSPTPPRAAPSGRPKKSIPFDELD